MPRSLHQIETTFLSQIESLNTRIGERKTALGTSVDQLAQTVTPANVAAVRTAIAALYDDLNSNLQGALSTSALFWGRLASF